MTNAGRLDDEGVATVLVMGTGLRDRAGAPVALAAAILAISTSAILAREADADALAIAFWRTSVAAAVLMPIFAVRARRRRLRDEPGGRQPRVSSWITVGSGALLALHFALWLGSLELTTVASSVTFLSMSPVFVGILSTSLLNEGVSRLGWIGIGVTVLGGAVIAFADGGGSGDASSPLLGDLMALAGGAAVAGYLLVARAARRSGLSNLAFAAPTYAIAAVLLGLGSVLTGVELIDFPTRTWIIFGLIAIGPQLIGHGSLTWALGRLSAGTVSVATLFEPIGATVLAWVVLSELPVNLFWVGAPVVLVGLGVASYAEASATRRERVG